MKSRLITPHLWRALFAGALTVFALGCTNDFQGFSVTGNSSQSTGSTPTPTPSTSPTPTPTLGRATITWSAPTTNTNGSAITNLAGFYVYYGTSATSLTNKVTISNPAATSTTVTGLAGGTWYFTVSAYNTTGEVSAPSATGSKTIP